MRPLQRYFVGETIGDDDNDSHMETNDDATELSAGGRATLARALVKIEQMKSYINLGNESDENRLVKSTSTASPAKSTSMAAEKVATAASPGDGSEGYLQRRPKLGKLPSFIPIE